MKITPAPAGGLNIGSVGLERTSSDRIEAAKAIARGETQTLNIRPSDTPIDPLVAKTQESIRRVKMRTNVSPDRPQDIPQPTHEIVPQEPAISATSTNNDEASQETRPLSPQAAALAKQRRALQVKERELLEREKALGTVPHGTNDLEAKLKANPLKTLQELQLMNPDFYNQMTEYLLGQQNPEVYSLKAEIETLKNELKNQKEGIDKSFNERDNQAKQQALSEMRKEANALIAKDGNPYPLVKLSGKLDSVINLIERTFDQHGEVMDVSEALQLVNDQLKEDYTPVVDFLRPQTQQAPPQAESRPMMKTLTNQMTAQSQASDRRSRMLAALQHGRDWRSQLKRG